MHAGPAYDNRCCRAALDDEGCVLAWLGLIALVGIGACCLDALFQALGRRRDRIRHARGRLGRARSRRVVARLVPFAVAIVVLGGVLILALAGSGGGNSTGSPRATTQRSGRSNQPATTNRGPSGERKPAQVRVAVLNASHVASAANTEGTALRGAGYLIVDVGNAKLRTGRAVQCAPGFEREAATLAKRLGGHATVEAFPHTAAASAAGADCLVLLGA